MKKKSKLSEKVFRRSDRTVERIEFADGRVAFCRDNGTLEKMTYPSGFIAFVRTDYPRLEKVRYPDGNVEIFEPDERWNIDYETGKIERNLLEEKLLWHKEQMK